MNATYAEALAGRLKSSDDASPSDFTIANGLCVPLALAWLSAEGEQWGFDPDTGRCTDGAPAHAIPPGRSVLLPGVPNGYWWLLTTRGSGAFAGVVGKGAPSAGTKRFVDLAAVTLSPDGLVRPNALGHPPRTTPHRVVPGDSPRVLVGCGMAATAPAPGVVVAREQYWQLAGDSYSLAPGERRTISYTETVGMESTSSTSKTVAESLGVSVSGGWGPVSASMSASLSTSSTTFQQVSLSTERTTFVSREIHNGEAGTMVVLVWQLVDAITVYDGQGKPGASVISAINPAIVQVGRLDPVPPPPAAAAPDELDAPRIHVAD